MLRVKNHVNRRIETIAKQDYQYYKNIHTITRICSEIMTDERLQKKEKRIDIESDIL